MSRALMRLLGLDLVFGLEILVVEGEVSDLRGRPRGLEESLFVPEPEGRGGLKGLGGIVQEVGGFVFVERALSGLEVGYSTVSDLRKQVGRLATRQDLADATSIVGT